MIPITDQQLQDFCAILEWQTATRLPDGRVLGNPVKRQFLSDGVSDYRLIFLASQDPSLRGSVLEMGCGEGYHTVQLAGLFRQVTAIEVRPKNVACALINLFVHGVQNARVVLGDVRGLGETIGRFDVLFHSGVLYHLMDPVEHLFNVAGIADALLLDTHYCRDDTRLERSDVEHEGRSYRAYLWAEGDWSDVFSGLDSTSRWLHRDALLQVVRDIGFETVDVFADYEDAAGPRLALWARHRR